MKNRKILVTGGGSGGHISAAQSLIQELLRQNINTENIVYVGGDLGMVGEKPGNSIDIKTFKNSPFKTYYIRAGKLQRKISLNTIFLLFRTLLGLVDSIKIINTEKPDIIISTGGFVSVPICLVAWIYSKDIYLHEQTASVGLANRVVGKLAKKVYISFKDSSKYFSNKKVKHVGNMVRPCIISKDYKNISKEFKTFVERETKYPLIYISGGGLGSHIINEKIISELNTLLKDYRVILQTGDNQIYKDYETLKNIQKNLSPNLSKHLLVTKYIDENNIGYVYNNATLFIGRSGANTVYELGVLEKPSILIPIPWVTNNEQYLNAKVLSDIGIADILPEKDLENVHLKNKIDEFLYSFEGRDIDYGKLNKLFPTDSSYKLVTDILT